MSLVSARSDNIGRELSNFLKESCGIKPQIYTLNETAYVKIDKHQIIKINTCTEEAGLNNRQEQIKYADKKINLYHLWEDLWYTKSEILKSRIRSIIGQSNRIYGRETEVKKIDNDVLVSFLTQNHTAVPLKAKHKYGLYHKGTLVAIASFAPPRKLNAGNGNIKSYELLRHTNINHHTVVGGLSKLLKAFINDKAPDDIMTYLDNDWPGGHSFFRLHFKKTGALPPFKFYIDTQNWKRIHPGNINEYLGINTSINNGNNIKEIMQEKCMVSVYNSGSSKLNLTLPPNKN